MLTPKAVMGWALNIDLITHSLTNSHIVQRTSPKEYGAALFDSGIYFSFPTET